MNPYEEPLKISFGSPRKINPNENIMSLGEAWYLALPWYRKAWRKIKRIFRKLRLK